MNDTPQGDGNFISFLFNFQCPCQIRMNDTP